MSPNANSTAEDRDLLRGLRTVLRDVGDPAHVLVRAFVEEHRHIMLQSPILQEAVESADRSAVGAIRSFVALHGAPLSLELVQHLLGAQRTRTDRKSGGVVYTPGHIVAAICDRVIALRGEFGGARSDPSEWVVLDPAKTIRQRTEVTDGRNMKVLDPEGKLRHTVEFTSKGFKVIYPDGNLLCRIEFIDDKNFHIYNPKNKITMSGRSKGKAITVKDVNSKQRLFKIKGKVTIEDGSFFAIPLQFTETVVIWRTASK